MGIDFSYINSPAHYSDGVKVNDHLPSITFDDGSKFNSDKTYENFGFAVLSNNGTMVNGQDLKQKLTQSRADKANQLGLRGSAFSDYVELGIDVLKSNRDNAITSLPQVPSDKTFQNAPTPTTGTSLVQVLKNAQDNQSEILSQTLNAFNEITTLLLNQNELLLEKNKIDLDRNRIMETMQLSQNAKDAVLVESMTSLAQSLEYIPTLIETIAIGNDKQSALLNTQNSHLFQKNVNDAYAFNYNKDDEKSPKKSLDAIAGNLASIGQVHSKIQEHQEKQAIDAENNIKDYLDEKSPKKSLDAIAGNLATISQSHSKIQEHQEKQAIEAENNIKDYLDENSPKKSLETIAGNLTSLGQVHSKIQEHQEKQAIHAENKIKDYEDENSPEALSFYDSVLDFFDGVKDEAEDSLFGDDQDIFTYFINQTKIKEENLKNVK